MKNKKVKKILNDFFDKVDLENELIRIMGNERMKEIDRKMLNNLGVKREQDFDFE